jgi:hypothetical protein
MCARGQIFPSEVRERGFPVILIALSLAILTRMAQQAGQFRQDVATHFSSSAWGAFFWRGKAERALGCPIIRLAPTAAPVTTDTLMNVLLFIFNPFGFIF